MTRDHVQNALTSAGFTLIETLVVLTIFALVAALSFPVITRPSDRFALATAERETLAALRLTRSAAITRNKELVFTIDTDLRIYESPAIGKGKLPPKVELALKIAEPERSSPSRGSFRFYPDGSSTGGELTLKLGDRQVNLCVNWLTGLPVRSDRC